MKCFFDEQDLHDILSGSVFLACGGGCSIVGGKKMMDAVLNITDKVEYVPFENVDKGKFMAVHAGMGSSGALKENPPLEFGTLRSFNLLEDTLKKKLFATGRKGEYSLSYVVPVESSALAYFMCMLTGVQKKIPVLDGDGGGRAFPKLSMCTFASVGVPVSPAVLVNELPMDDGGTELIMNQESSDVVDELCRAVLDTPVFNNAASLAGFAMSGETLHRENAVVRNTLTKARDIGRVIRRIPGMCLHCNDDCPAIFDYYGSGQCCCIADRTCQSIRNNGEFCFHTKCGYGGDRSDKYRTCRRKSI